MMLMEIRQEILPEDWEMRDEVLYIIRIMES